MSLYICSWTFREGREWSCKGCICVCLLLSLRQVQFEIVVHLMLIEIYSHSCIGSRWSFLFTSFKTNKVCWIAGVVRANIWIISVMKFAEWWVHRISLHFAGMFESLNGGKTLYRSWLQSLPWSPLKILLYNASMKKYTNTTRLQHPNV